MIEIELVAEGTSRTAYAGYCDNWLTGITCETLGGLKSCRSGY
jgi:hypothetical protein